MPYGASATVQDIGRLVASLKTVCRDRPSGSVDGGSRFNDGVDPRRFLGSL